MKSGNIYRTSDYKPLNERILGQQGEPVSPSKGRSLARTIAKATLVTAVATVVVPPLLLRAACVGLYDLFTSDEPLRHTY